jgi:hypothetical protein
MLVHQRDRPVVIEHDYRVNEFDSVLAEILLGLLRIPLELQVPVDTFEARPPATGLASSVESLRQVQA